MKVDPFTPQLLIDYTYFCDRFGPLPFGDFVAMWHAADALMEAATGAGYEPHEVPDLLITADNPAWLSSAQRLPASGRTSGAWFRAVNVCGDGEGSPTAGAHRLRSTSEVLPDDWPFPAVAFKVRLRESGPASQPTELTLPPQSRSDE